MCRVLGHSPDEWYVTAHDATGAPFTGRVRKGQTLVIDSVALTILSLDAPIARCGRCGKRFPSGE